MDNADTRTQQLAEREEDISRARAELRAEREQILADRAEADRLLAEARNANREATRARSRARRLAGRFASQLEERTASTRQQLEQQRAELSADRAKFATEVTQFQAGRDDFHAATAAASDRLRDAWATVEAQQKRAAEEWAEANRYFTEQTAALDARAAEMAQQEKLAGKRLAQAEAETAGLQAEASALEQRVKHGLAALAELERRRDRIRAELLQAELPADLMLNATSSDVAQREMLLTREKAAVAKLRASLERESADVDDRRRLIAEQLTQLSDARVQWQRAERQTVLEMEELARSLRCKEQELDSREQRLIRADVRRRSEAYELWQFRLRLEAWQTNLTAFEKHWHAEREQLEADLERRIAAITRREAALDATFARWEQARMADHARLREELERWTTERHEMMRAIAETEQLRQELLAELTTHAARALAAEQLVSEAIHDAGSKRVARRLTVLRKQWERIFDRKARAVGVQQSEQAAERAMIEERYQKLQTRLTQVIEREAEIDSRQAAVDREAILDAGTLQAAFSPVIVTEPSAELVALRGEVERLAAVMLKIELPEALSEAEIPWAIEETEPANNVLPFEQGSRAA